MKVFRDWCLSIRRCLLILLACLIVGSALVTDLFAEKRRPDPPPEAPVLSQAVTKKMAEVILAITGAQREIVEAGTLAKNAKTEQTRRVEALTAEVATEKELVATEKELKEGLLHEKEAWVLAKTEFENQARAAAREKIATRDEYTRAMAAVQEQMREAGETNTRVATEKDVAHRDALRLKDAALVNSERALNEQRINELAAKEALIQAAGIRLEQANEVHAAALLAKDRLIQAETDKLTQANQTNAAAVARLNEEHATEKKALEDAFVLQLTGLQEAILELQAASLRAIKD